MIFFLITIIIFLLLALYFIFHIRKLKYIKTNKKIKITCGGLILILISMSFMTGKTVIKSFFLILLVMLLSLLITDLINIFIKLFIKKEYLKEKWNSIYCSGILAVILGIIFIPVSYATSKNVVNTNYEIHSNKLLESLGMDIVMLSDLHLDTTMDTNKLSKYCDDINQKKPDLVVLVGDIFDESTTRESMETASKLLGNIKSKYGIYYVYGNHDSAIYGRKHEFTVSDVLENLSLNNIVVLDDEYRLINNEFYIVGREDKSMSHNNRKTISELTNNLDRDKFILLLDHQPLDFKEAAENKVDLQLSGHTHNGQIWPFGIFIDIFKTADLTYGYKNIGDYNAIVSSGMGCWGYPLKFGTKAEIVNIRINFGSN